ncbi:MAG: DNA repair protein RecO [Agriterribacter sp.]
MVFPTKGIVLRTVAYGETSVIALLYTEAFGLQSYLVNGVRTTAKTAVKGSLLQPGSILDLEVYHNELKNLQRIKEAKWHYIYQQIFFNVYKNAVAMFMTELLQKVIRQPESNPDLYNFIEDAYIQLDKAEPGIALNFPVFFALHLTLFFGSRIQDDFSPEKTILDLREGCFIAERPIHPFFVEGAPSSAIGELLKVMQPHELGEIQLNNKLRRQIIESILQFYGLHIQDFGSMKSLAVLQEVLA